MSNQREKRTSVSPRVSLATGGGVLALVACSVVPFGATDAHLAQARHRAVEGSAVFEHSCVSCHGPRGEGRGNVPAIVGPGALERHPVGDATLVSSDPAAGQGAPSVPTVAPPPEQGRPEFVMAQSLYTYLAYHMPKIHREEMTEQDYWALVNFLLIAHGSDVPEEGISPENADQVRIAVR